MTAAHQVNWTRACLKAEAFVILDHETATDMTVLAKRGLDGQLYGCRDVTNGDKHDAIVDAWIRQSVAEGLVIEDLRASADTPTRAPTYPAAVVAMTTYRLARTLNTAAAYEAAAHALAGAVASAWGVGEADRRPPVGQGLRVVVDNTKGGQS